MLLIAYAFFMLCLMFFFRSPADEHRLSIKLFSSSRSFINMYKYGDLASKLTAIGNLAGNFIMFIPIGLLFPRIWKLQGNYLVFVLTVIVVISVLEAAQFLTYLGTADLDDLLYNTIGASIGFIIDKIRAHRS